MTTSTTEQATLAIHTHLTNDYQILDRSGRLPFCIIFGLCRKSPKDTNPRSLTFNVKGSALDVPYALASGLLSLREQGTNGKPGVEADVSQLRKAEGETAYITLPSPVNRSKSNGSKFGHFTTYSYRIEPNSAVAALLKPGGSYRISLATPELGLKLQTHGSDGQQFESDDQLRPSSDQTQYVNSKATSGSATFKVAASLPWPPDVVTHMRLCSGEASSDTQFSAAVLEFSIINTGCTPISVQCRGDQHYLTPSTFFTSVGGSEDGRTRIIDSLASAWPCLEIEDAKTGAVVYRHSDRRVCCLYDTTVDRRIRLSDLLTLMPGEPFIRCVDISQKLATLPNGEYRMRLRAKGVWWCSGTVEQISDEGDDRVPRRLHRTTIPPVQLQCDEAILLRVVDGIVVEQIS